MTEKQKIAGVIFGKVRGNDWVHGKDKVGMDSRFHGSPKVRGTFGQIHENDLVHES